MQRSSSSQTIEVYTHSPSTQASVVQGSPSSQTIGVPAHLPPEQISFSVQSMPSSHGLVLSIDSQVYAKLHILFVQGLLSSQSASSSHLQVEVSCWQLPLTQLSFVHLMPSSQSIGVPEQSPSKHTSSIVQASSSLHKVPSCSFPVIPVSTH